MAGSDRPWDRRRARWRADSYGPSRRSAWSRRDCWHSRSRRWSGSSCDRSDGRRTGSFCSRRWTSRWRTRWPGWESRCPWATSARRSSSVRSRSCRRPVWRPDWWRRWARPIWRTASRRSPSSAGSYCTPWLREKARASARRSESSRSPRSAYTLECCARWAWRTRTRRTRRSRTRRAWEATALCGRRSTSRRFWPAWALRWDALRADWRLPTLVYFSSFDNSAKSIIYFQETQMKEAFVRATTELNSPNSFLPMFDEGLFLLKK